ncbi:N-acetyltransferase [Streptomyces spiroverticillatus]|uniref:N-acetyltransferase n=1 Tax=Streptomyces finlayi TaxID=67296 RepID=A0A918X3Q9_9ACTN|nr:N-acetyltransferase [Streptomyces finlayi]GGZ95085.1 N-acetyltransferase [Streptomyces spiroverticillatus]GHD07383.1 N-acetyltransferase [Streptomyces finlayi]
MNHATPPVARRATAEDAAEVLRLRQIMLDSMREGEGAPTDWQAGALPGLRKRLAAPDGDFAAFVTEHPAGDGRLASLAVGAVDYRIGGPGEPLGERGHVFSVATDPEARRLGHARSCMDALLTWFRDRGVLQVGLSASAQAEPLYTALGFTRRPQPEMRLRL